MGTHWSARSGGKAVVFNNNIWVLGGYDGSYKNDVWSSSDGENWTNANARGPAVEPATDPVTYSSHWSARGFYAVVVFKNKIWVLGGIMVALASMTCGRAVMAPPGRRRQVLPVGLPGKTILRWCLITRSGSWAVMMEVVEKMTCGRAVMASTGQKLR